MIGIFDTGITGIALVRALKAALPGYDMVYLGDTLHMPYGNKSADAIARLVFAHLEFLVRSGATLTILAGQAASAVASDRVAGSLEVPVIDGLTCAASQAVALSKTHRIGVIGSAAVVDSGIYEKKIRALAPSATVSSAAAPLIEAMVENRWHQKPEFNRILKKYLHPLKVRQVDTLILGSTNCCMVKKTVQRKIGKRVVLVDPLESTVHEIKKFLTMHPDVDQKLQKNNRLTCYVTDITPAVEHLARDFFKKKIYLNRISV